MRMIWFCVDGDDDENDDDSDDDDVDEVRMITMSDDSNEQYGDDNDHDTLGLWDFFRSPKSDYDSLNRASTWPFYIQENSILIFSTKVKVTYCYSQYI